MKTIIINAIIVTMNEKREILESGFAIMEKDLITKVGTMEEFHSTGTAADIRIVDAKGGILMPGMINLHTHMGMIPFRGLGDDCKDRLRVFLLPMEQQAMDEEMVYLSTRYAAGEMLLSGVTTAFDMYYYELEAARAMDEMGIRGIAGQTIMEHGACDFKNPYEALAYGEQMMENYKNHSRITGCVTPHGTTTCSEAVLKSAHDLDQKFKAPFSLHMAEMDYEMDYFEESEYGTPTAYLDRIGVLDERTVAAHCIHMTEDDLELLSRRKTGVAHCIGSNTKAAKGVAPISRMCELGVSVGFGTDGPASGNTLDILTQMKLFADFHKNETKNRSAFPAEKIVAMATINGAKTLHMGAEIGSIEAGKKADLVLIETQSANMFPIYDPYSALVYSANPSNVTEVYVDGECLVRDKKLVQHELKELRETLARKMKNSVFGTMNQMN